MVIKVNLNTILDNFQEFIEAPNGIRRFNDLILDLAVSGRLNLGSTQPIDDKTGLPVNWEIKTFTEIASFTIGKTPPTKDSSYWGSSDSIMWVSIADIQSGESILQSRKYVTKSAQEKIFRREPWPVGTLLMSFKLTIGKIARLGKPAFFNEAIFAFDSGNQITNEYLFRVLPVLSQKAESKGAIKGNTLNSDSIRKMLIPMPPIDEQEILIRVIDEISDKCKALEEQSRASATLCNYARKSAIEAISTAQTPEELQIAWKRIQTNWGVISGNPESIHLIRDLIRELAVRGVFTNESQDSRARNEVQGGGLFATPVSWRWVRLGEVIDFVNGYAFKSVEYTTTGVGVVRMSDLKSGRIVPDHMKHVTPDRLTSLPESFQVKPGDIVMGMTGATLGKPCVNSTTKTFLLNQRIGKFIPKDINPDFLMLVLSYLENSFMSLSFGTGVNNLSTQQIKDSLIPLPPGDEQIKIVKTVSDLLSICDKLEYELGLAQGISEQFARSVVSVSA